MLARIFQQMAVEMLHDTGGVCRVFGAGSHHHRLLHGHSVHNLEQKRRHRRGQPASATQERQR